MVDVDHMSGGRVKLRPGTLGSALVTLPLLLVLLAAIALSVAARRSAGAGANPQARG